jgi:hypothetical protein
MIIREHVAMSRCPSVALAILCASAGTASGQAAPRIIELRQIPTDAPIIRFSAKPLTQFGGEERDSSTVQSSGALRRLGDGRFVMQVSYTPPGTSGRIAELRLYSADGRLLQRGGRYGRGPGELGTPGLLGILPGDSILVATPGRPPMIFDPSFRYVRDYGAHGLRSVPQPRGMLIDGTIIIDYQASMPGRGSIPDTMHVFRATDEVWSWSRASAPTVKLFEITRPMVRPGIDRSTTVSSGNVFAASSGVFNPALLPTPLPVMPSRFVGARGRTVWSFDPEKWELTTREPTGEPRAIVRPPIPARNVGFTIGNLVPRDQSQTADVIIGEDERLWIELAPDAARADGGKEWLVVTSNGELAGVARTPAGFFPNQFGSDFASGLQRDASGRWAITVYSIEPR